jgi:hypothetical protein
MYHVFLFFGSDSSVWTQTLDPGMTRRVFYHCATTHGRVSNYFVEATSTPSWGLYYKTFYDRNLRIFVIS